MVQENIVLTDPPTKDAIQAEVQEALEAWASLPTALSTSPPLCTTHAPTH